MWDERMRHYSFRRFLHRTLRHSVWLYSQFLGSSPGTPGTFGTKPIHLTTKYDEERLAFLDSSFLRGSYGSSNKKSWLCSILFQSMQDSAWAREKRREKHETLSACSNWTSIYIYISFYLVCTLCVMWFYETSWLQKVIDGWVVKYSIYLCGGSILVDNSF